VNPVLAARQRSRFPKTGADVSLDLSCQIDPVLFQAGCRAPIFPGKWNRWVVAASETFGGITMPLFPPAPTPTVTSKPSVPEQTQAVAERVCRWFNKIEGVEYTFDDCPATNIVVTPLAQRDPTAAWKPLVDWSRCSTAITIEEDIQVLYSIEFVYRGQFNDAPWPTWAGAIRGWCPVDASIAVMQVYEPSAVDSQGQPVPPPKESLVDRLNPFKDAKMPWGWILLGGLGIVAITRVVK